MGSQDHRIFTIHLKGASKDFRNPLIAISLPKEECTNIYLELTLNSRSRKFCPLISHRENGKSSLLLKFFVIKITLYVNNNL